MSYAGHVEPSLTPYQAYRCRVGGELIFPFSKTKGRWRVVNESDKHNKGPEIRLVENR
jgi:hypothetical protein